MADTPPGFPIEPPIEPMLARLATELPPGDGWMFEPKWDGFRAIVFRGGDRLYVQSRDLRPLDRYFPDLAEPLRRTLPPRCVVDGEIVIAAERGLDFDALQLRLHPAASRVAKLAAERPASFVAFDLLASGDGDLRELPQAQRRERLEAALGERAQGPVHLTPCSRDRAVAQEWFHRFEGAGLDGVIAKHEATTYQPGKRAMIKVKHNAAGGGAGAAAGRRALRPSLARVGRSAGGVGAHAGRPEPLEPEQGPLVGAAADRARVRGEVRPPAAGPLPPRGGLRAVAAGQAPGRLPLRPARGDAARRAGRDLHSPCFMKPLRPASAAIASLAGSSRASRALAAAGSAACVSGRRRAFWYCCCGLSHRQ